MKRTIEKLVLIAAAVLLLLRLTFCGGYAGGYSTEDSNKAAEERRVDSVRLVIDGILWRYGSFQSQPLEVVLDKQARKQNDSKLDSAICVVDDNIENDKLFLSLKKAAIYALKKDYVAGLHTLQSINESLMQPPYKHAACKHFEAMIAQDNNQLALRDSLIQDIMDTLQVVVPQEMVDDVMKSRNEDRISCNIKHIPIKLYYYYAGQIYGVDSIRTMLRKRYDDPYGTFTQVIEPCSNDFMTSYGDFVSIDYWLLCK